MRQFQVPQFIDVEDKIIGPLTLKQFLYLAAGGALITIARALFLPLIFYPFALVCFTLALALAFYKVNGIPFAKVLLSALSYFSKPHLYIWKQEEMKEKRSPTAITNRENQQLKIPNVAESKLDDLAWSLDIKEKLQR